MNRPVLLLFLVLLVQSANAQYYPLPDFNYEWTENEPQPIAVNPDFTNYPAVVLDDQLKTSVRGQKEAFIYVYFERKRRVKIQSAEDGKLPFTQFLLPESLDPFFDSRNLPINYNSDSLAADYLNVQMLYFAARKINPDGSTKELAFSDHFVAGQIEMYERFEKQFRYAFRLMGVEAGDEIEIHYKYEVPYRFNWMFFNAQRIFFHGPYPIQNQRVEIAAPKHLATEFVGSPADSSYTRKNRKYKIWHYTDLEGCTRERGIRPSDDLPHIVYSLNTKGRRFQIQHPQSDQYLPPNYVMSMLRFREQEALWLRRRTLEAANRDAQSVKVNEFIEKETAGLPNDQPLLRFDRLHSVISNEFDFQWDDAYFAEQNMGLEKVGDQVEAKTIRETSRYNLYARLANILGIKYYTTYLLDSRVGKLSSDYTSNLFFIDFAFALPDGDFLSLYYPKKDVFGYEPDEFPFYLSGAPAFFVDVDELLFEEEYKPEVIHLPRNTTENYRHTVINALVDAEQNSAVGTIETELVGQFSTLTRSAYDFGRIDSSINPQYLNKPLWNRSVNYSNIEQTESSLYPPYTRVYKMDYELLDISTTTTTDNDLTIPMKGWFNFITWPDFEKHPRVLPFYADFAGQDLVRIHLTFNRAVEIQNLSDFEFQQENRFGSLDIEVAQPAPDQITIEAHYNFFADKVAPEKANLITDLFRAVDQLNSSELKLKWATGAEE